MKHKIWVSNNREKMREIKNKWHKKQMQINPDYKIKRNLRRRIGLALKDQGVSKHKSLIKYIGCSIEYFKKYIEECFDENMTWENYGEWHIDHIKSCVKFNLTKVEEQKKCFYYTNLQPLWGIDNWKKGTK